LRHEKPGRLKQDSTFRVKVRFPGVCSIKFDGIDIAYAFTPIDDHRSWIWTRYTHDKLRSYLGGGVLPRFFAAMDYFFFIFRAFTSFDPKWIRRAISRSFVSMRRIAIGRFFGMVKRAMLEAQPSAFRGTGDDQ
jgi:hypothetical protein